MQTRLTGKKLIGLAIAALILVRLLIAIIPVRLQISPETTVIDSPLRADGTPDYAAYLNDEWSAGVTPENNAAVDLLRAFGPEIVDREVRQAYFDRIGVPVPAGPGDYVEFREYLHVSGIVDRHDWEHLQPLEEAAADCQSQPWTAEEYPEVAAWLDSQQPALTAFLAASQKPRFFSPLVAPQDGNLLSALLPVVQNSRQGIRLLMTQAMLELGHGNVERACELTLACHRLSRLLSEHPTMVGQLVSYACLSMASSGDQAIVLSGRLSQDQAVACREGLNDLSPFRSMAEVIDRGERFIALDIVISMYAGRLRDDNLELPPQSMKWMLAPNPMLVKLNQAYGEVREALALPNRTQRRLALDNFERRNFHVERPSVWAYGLAMAIGSRAMISEYVGRITVPLMMTGIVQALRAEEGAHVRLQLTDVGYALAAYNAEHGAFPESLEALVPDLLPAVPLDPLTGDPLRYELKEDGFLLYSLGVNGLDDGGLMDGRTDADDIAFGIVPEPPEGD